MDQTKKQELLVWAACAISFFLSGAYVTMSAYGGGAWQLVEAACWAILGAAIAKLLSMPADVRLQRFEGARKFFARVK